MNMENENNKFDRDNNELFASKRHYAHPVKNIGVVENRQANIKSNSTLVKSNSISNKEQRTNNLKMILIGATSACCVIFGCYFIFKPAESKTNVVKIPEVKKQTEQVIASNNNPKNSVPEVESKVSTSQGKNVTINGSSVIYKNELAANNSSAPKNIYLTTTDSPGFYRYTNGRFGFQIRVPSELTRARASANGDGCVFLSDDGKVMLAVYGSHEYRAIDDLYRSDLKNRNNTTGMKNPYTAKGGTWYVVTWENGDTAHYLKKFVDKKMQNTMHFSYPKALRPTHSKLIDAMEEDFRPGWKTGVKIRS